MTRHNSQVKLENSQKKFSYSKFKKIDGKHPFQLECPHSCVLYKARKRSGGKVAFFNFDLAKEMGLISKDHPNELTKELEKNILETFSIVIINEYDEINNIKYPESEILPNKYMATRYLQMQHPNKQGKTSGDGRSVWNGSVTSKGKSWDISSCGTGATSLSPATHIKKRYFKTGDPSISYGCGYSEKEEGLATLFFSEIMNKNGFQTERCLGIIEFSKGISINIRAHENLMRPSHMFNHMKQGSFDSLKNVVDYYIERQVQNTKWSDVPKSDKKKYDFFLDKQVEVFANLAADFEDNYIFCWLDWDGDNILMDGGIIDYGSIRQFGLFHHEYRFDDVERYSTTIKEQKDKAKHIVLTFEQIVSFLQTGKKSPLKFFKNSKSQRKFDSLFRKRKNENLLVKMGLEKEHVDYIMKKHQGLVKKFRDVFFYFEKTKSKKGLYEVPDGINWSAIFCMRDILRELPQIYLSRESNLTSLEFIEIAKSNYALEEDLKVNSYREKQVRLFQKYYHKIVENTCSHFKTEKSQLLLKITMRSSIINKYDRVTGDSISNIVEKVSTKRPKINAIELHELLHEFSEYQGLNPDEKRKNRPLKEQSSIMKGMLKIVRDFREGL